MMEQKSMSALVSAFSRAYHFQNNEVRIFSDNIASSLFAEEEYRRISTNMAEGINFFHPSFSGSPEAALKWIVDNQLSPTPLGRAAFAEKSLEAAVSIGARQYLILGAGYDTFAYRQPNWAKDLRIFELDHPTTAQDKKERLEASDILIPDHVHFVATDFTEEHWQHALMREPGFQPGSISFCSILGVAYYLSKQTFQRLLCALQSLLPAFSSIVFDYPSKSNGAKRAGQREEKQAMLAEAAKEKMLASYSYEEMEDMLAAHSFLIYEHITPLEITAQYFSAYNQANPACPMRAFDNVDYCLAVKK